VASKDDEKRAWARMCRALPRGYITLECEYMRSPSDSTKHIIYKAYSGVDKPTFSDSVKTPKEAVDQLLERCGICQK
jgi:hypothetical protein